MNESQIKLPFGLQNGKLVHISVAERGLKCNCICPSCKVPLVARKGKINIHHFAHHNTEECKNGIGVAIRLAAKGILENRRLISVPPVFAKIENKKIKIKNSSVINFEKVYLKKFNDSKINALYIEIKKRKLLLDFTIQKTDKTSLTSELKLLQQSALNIDVRSFLDDNSLETLETILIDTIDNKKWLHNQLQEKAIKKFKEIQLQKQIETEQKAKREEEQLRPYYRQISIERNKQNGTVEWHIHNCPLKKLSKDDLYFADYYSHCLSCRFNGGVRNNKTALICNHSKAIE